ncbi:hypothetical protein MUCCIDRAFT_155267 [Mucor lusitanicus CBS 277.49]|uniref:Uncharacterized protein n=1 Tax=Mucor lusitanicus CBS 277.49 TaxID=747725 RepID=A0A162QWC1_MUCCL|nr:hypothetical protein MUCCIDRAFT_155267 [Mucor lusitanicus CBS 277.49]
MISRTNQRADPNPLTLQLFQLDTDPRNSTCASQYTHKLHSRGLSSHIVDTLDLETYQPTETPNTPYLLLGVAVA